jgi:hypothetical protein
MYHHDIAWSGDNITAMSITAKVKVLHEARAKVAIMEQAIAADLNRELAALPAQYGFASVADFVAAGAKATGKHRSRKPGQAEVASAAETKSEAPARRNAEHGPSPLPRNGMR